MGEEDLLLCSSNLSGKLQQTFSPLPTADLPSVEGLQEAPSGVQPVRACTVALVNWDVSSAFWK